LQKLLTESPSYLEEEPLPSLEPWNQAAEVMKDVLVRTVLENGWIKHKPSPAQAPFLILPHLEILFGGAAGGGKSEALLAAALQYVDYPGYSAILFRRTYKDLALPGALMDRAAEWLANTGAKWVSDNHAWRFPSGASLAFGYLESEFDKLRYQGAEFQFIGFDEVTQFTETQYTYLFSRLRRTSDSVVPLRMRCASNPGGVGHDWVKARFITDPSEDRLFIPAKLKDNPFLDQTQYQKALEKLDDVTKAQLLDGDWDVRAEGALMQREWFEIVEYVPQPREGTLGATMMPAIRAWDIAASEKSAKKRDPDYTVGVLMRRSGDIVYIHDVIRKQIGPGDIVPLIVSTADIDGKRIRIEIERQPGGAGKILAQNIVTRLRGYMANSDLATGDKVTRAMPFISQAKVGNVKLLKGRWNKEFLNEMVAFPTGSHDDQIDAVSTGFSKLTTWGPLPNIRFRMLRK
jgi:predicted phage terminase large subunit-like protein